MTMYIRAYKPMVMYFGLTNSPATFQTMINNLFHNMINQGNTATFIDNIIVAMDIKDGHDKIVEEVLRRLEENNLFVKPEKCRWNVKKVEFLGIVIGLGGVKMQQEKIKGVSRSCDTFQARVTTRPLCTRCLHHPSTLFPQPLFIHAHVTHQTTLPRRS